MRDRFNRIYLFICAIGFLIAGIVSAIEAIVLAWERDWQVASLPLSIIAAGCLVAFAAIEVALAIRDRDHNPNHN